MRNSQRQKFASTDPKKTVTILKCFLCNQLFYAQNIFDSHMKQHQSKINRNIPDQIQRRTMDSFRNSNKDKFTHNKTTLLPVQGNSITIPKQKQPIKPKKNVLYSTLRQPKRSILINQAKKQEFSQIPDEIRKIENSNVDELLQESTILMERISFLTQQDYGNQQQEKDQQQAKNQTLLKREVIQKNMNENQFERLIQKQLNETGKVNNQKIEYLLLRTNFCRDDWKSYQQQFEYLQQLNEQFDNDEKIKKLKSKILQKLAQQIGAEMKIKHSQHERKQGDMLFCCDCFEQIDPNGEFQFRKCGHYYHKACGVQNPKCC